VACIGASQEDETEKLRWLKQCPEALLLLQTCHGRGSVLSFGAARSLSDRVIGEADNLDVLQALLRAWLGDVYPRELHRRQGEPQRHRLLQGYPMAPLLPPADAPPSPPTSDRPLIVGVLPHPSCNPSVTGCGFCTFPHEPFKASRASASAAAAKAELEACFAAHPHLSARRLEAIYFGGGTANLTPAADFDALCQSLAAHLDTSGAEVTLEGVPRYFLLKDGVLLGQMMERFPTSTHRISMGVQTFSPTWLKEMGRESFGTRDDIARVLASAHDRGATASGDFLINLPGQSCAEMLADIATAVDLGFDQICLYHLVLFEGLGTEWSTDPEKLAALPSNPEAAASWMACRQALIEAGYTQTTLTNFERRPGFRYERSSFQPGVFDALGFGPGAISTLTDGDRATKWLSASDTSTYVERVSARGWFPERAFSYDRWDLRLLHLTRQLARLRIDRASYQARFGADVLDEFSEPLSALIGGGLLSASASALEPTPLGMFYADTIAGMLAWPRAVTHRARQVLSGGSAPASQLDLSRYERARSHHMG
jgi:oxygen-independent coproporphyrinogen-3 oxidase